MDWLALPKTSGVLEIGCGAGLTTVAIADRGYRVSAVDTVQDMIDYTRELAERTGVSDRVKTSLGDVHRLEAADSTYDLVVTIGVLPWLRDLQPPLVEMRRVLRPGGALIVNIDNKWSLHRLLDPLLNPVVQPLKGVQRDALCRAGWREAEAFARTASRGHFDRELRQLGFPRLRA